MPFLLYKIIIFLKYFDSIKQKENTDKILYCFTALKGFQVREIRICVTIGTSRPHPEFYCFQFA